MTNGSDNPCPCGSSKQFKDCCGNHEPTIHAQLELVRRRLRKEMRLLRDSMMHFARQHYGAGSVDEAWQEFLLADHSEEHHESLSSVRQLFAKSLDAASHTRGGYDQDSPFAWMFVGWFLHHWSPKAGHTRVSDQVLHGVTPTHAYLDQKGDQLSPIVKEYLQSCLRRAFSFYDIERVNPGDVVALRDKMTGEPYACYMPGRARGLRVGNLMFALLAEAGGVTMLEAKYGRQLLIHEAYDVITLRRKLRTAETQDGASGRYVESVHLRKWECALREACFAVERHMREEVRDRYLPSGKRKYEPRPLPDVTAQGDVIEFHKLVYEIDDPTRVLDELSQCFVIADDPDATRPDIRHNTEGVVWYAELDVVRPEPDAALIRLPIGRIRILDNRFTIAVNSRQTAEWFKDAIACQSLGGLINPLSESMQTLEAADLEHKSRPADDPWSFVDGGIIRYVGQWRLVAHYTGWLDEPRANWNNCTPRQLAESEDGLEYLAATLRRQEKGDWGRNKSVMQRLFDRLCEILGVPR